MRSRFRPNSPKLPRQPTDRGQVNYPGSVARVALKATLEGDPTERWTIGSNVDSVDQLRAADLFSATAARMNAFNAFSLILSPSRISMARLTLPSRLELNRPDGSSNEAPLAKVTFTTALYVSPVQMIPSCSHTGTPRIEFDGFLHFTSSTTSGSASLMSFRTRASVSPRQSLSALILASISREGEAPAFASFEPLCLFFMLMLVVAFFMVTVARPTLEYRCSALGALHFISA